MNSQVEWHPLSEGEIGWIAELTARAQSLGVDIADPKSIEAWFDTMLTAVEDGAQPAAISNDVVNLTAIAVGEHLRAKLGLQWRIFSDEQGADLCLHTPALNWTLFPQSSTAKRWAAHEKGWIVRFIDWASDNFGKPVHH
ncbi:MAG: DUF3806 domain-containing protein [Propionibacteriaceae bacterium]|nr:DUF3806 domain-containing protein [Propionibacteriaceae bacterium]